jgi:hypothetical protein
MFTATAVKNRLSIAQPRKRSNMAKCEEGYLCDVCGGDVEAITDSDLYLRYVIGLVDPETLHTTRERHIRCNPALAQFIVDAEFPPVIVEGAFDKRQLDADYVEAQEALVTRGWRRLREVIGTEAAIINYPLPEVLARNAQRQF